MPCLNYSKCSDQSIGQSIAGTDATAVRHVPSLETSLDWLEPTIIAPHVFIVAAGSAWSDPACTGGLQHVAAVSNHSRLNAISVRLNAISVKHQVAEHSYGAPVRLGGGCVT